MSDTPLLPPMRLDTDGFPVLEEVVDEIPEAAIPTLNDIVEDNSESGTAEALKMQLLTELEPRLQRLVHAAFVETVKVVALQMKRNFERELDSALQTQLADMVDKAVDDIMQSTD